MTHHVTLPPSIDALRKVQFAERKLWNIAVTVVSLGLDVGCPDHFAPFLSFLGNELAEVGRREQKHC
jgi:hypothetical protein